MVETYRSRFRFLLIQRYESYSQKIFFACSIKLNKRRRSRRGATAPPRGGAVATAARGARPERRSRDSSEVTKARGGDRRGDLAAERGQRRRGERDRCGDLAAARARRRRGERGRCGDLAGTRWRRRHGEHGRIGDLAAARGQRRRGERGR